MISRFTGVLGIAMVLACLTIFFIWSNALAKNDENRITGTKENKAMDASHPKSAAPPIDAAQPEKFATATFALG